MSQSLLMDHFVLEVKTSMSVVMRATLLLVASNVFMTFAWYAH